MSVKAKVQMVLGALVGLLMLGACFGALYWLLLPGHFPITSVELTGNLKNSSKTEVQAALPRASAAISSLSTSPSYAPASSVCPGCAACRCGA